MLVVGDRGNIRLSWLNLVMGNARRLPRRCLFLFARQRKGSGHGVSAQQMACEMNWIATRDA